MPQLGDRKDQYRHKPGKIMRHFLTDARNIFFKTVLISFLFHLFLFNSFVFTFKTRATGRGPFFMYLGSILQNQDMLNFNFDRNKAKSIPLNVHSQAPVEQRLFTSIKKPPFPATASEEKILF